MPMTRRVRYGLVAATLCLAALPAIGNAATDPASCLSETDPADFALCVATAAGNTVSDAEEPAVGPRDAVREMTDQVLADAGLCDATDPAACLLPFPNDFFTVADPTTDTGRRVNFSPLAMPRNAAGKPIDPTEWNRNDGFSPGSPVLTVVPGLDTVRTGLAPITDIGRSLDADAPIVLLDTRTGARQPYFAELDANPTAGEQPVLITRPAVNFDEGTRYVVALRRMRDASGALIPANPVFAARRDGAVKKLDGKGKGQSKQVERDPTWGPLMSAGIGLDDLYLAWTFTVASERNLTERMLHIRDDAFASLGSASPAFSVTSVTNNAPTARIARVVQGNVTVPLYLTNAGAPGSRFNYLGSGDGLPTRLGGVATRDASFTCQIPRAAFAKPARISLYGHGLLGGQSEVGAGNVQKMADENDFVFCATDWIGMATEDVPNVATILADMSNFPTLADRAQQGFLNFLYLARAMKTGFAHDPAFAGLIDTSDVYYDGNSQGGIMGGALVAVAQDIHRAVLGVPAANYSILLDRSVDFATYESVFNAAYPSEVDREIVFGLIQMLWDRAEANGYAHHLTTDPLPNTPPHTVLMHLAFGDHQVANIASEIEARTIGAYTNAGFLAPGRHWAVEPGWGIPRIGAFPFAGSAVIYWDSGSDTPPNTNTPPYASTVRGDPHGDPRATRAARDQKAAFLAPDGLVIDVCGGGPCYARPLAPED